MKIIAIIQARMSSTRFYGKVLKKINKITMLEHVITRTSNAKLINTIIVATSTDFTDDKIEKLCKNKKILCYRGPLNNVLSRYYHVAKQQKADIIIRLTADCPLVDPILIDKAILRLKQGKYDYVTNKNEPVYLRGFEYEIMTFHTLSKAFHNATTIQEKEHVTPYIWNTHPKKFKILKLQYTLDKKNFRLCVDTKEDLKCVQILVREYHANDKSYSDIIKILIDHPEISAINANVKQKKYGL